MKPRIAINGFGRIGRQIFRINLEKQYFDIVAINDLTTPETLAHLLKYDSNFGILDAEVTHDDTSITVNGKNYTILSQRNPEQLPWKDLKVDYVIEATGFFRDRDGAQKHITAGAKKVIVSAPGKNLDRTIVLGVNEKTYNKNTDNLISNASCTTNGLAPIIKIIDEKFEIETGILTTIHSYTNGQKILDLPHKDLRRSRAAGLSMIPTTTGAATAVTEILPQLKGKLSGSAIRVPTPTVSIIDLVCTIKKETTKEEINKILEAKANGDLKGILGFNMLPLVSIDYKKNPLSSIVDGLSTDVIKGKTIKIMAWYDNEWGYSARTVDLIKYISEQ